MQESDLLESFVLVTKTISSIFDVSSFASFKTLFTVFRVCSNKVLQISSNFARERTTFKSCPSKKFSTSIVVVVLELRVLFDFSHCALSLLKLFELLEGSSLVFFLNSWIQWLRILLSKSSPPK